MLSALLGINLTEAQLKDIDAQNSTSWTGHTPYSFDASINEDERQAMRQSLEAHFNAQTDLDLSERHLTSTDAQTIVNANRRR